MTEATITEETILEADATLLHRVFLSTIEDVVEHVRAADTLGLGFRIESYTVTGADDPDAAPATEYEFTLLTELPARQESEF